jgi:hypothetical protein
MRRVTLDLTGLPPTPEEVEAFLGDNAGTEVAYQRWVDRLLQSPRYGERWAQHWLDVIRWAETVGFETNLPRPNAWPYRDWLIESFNTDMPYNEFVFRQLAGDTVGADAALGFLVAGPANLPGQIGRDEEAMRQARQDELDEVVRTVGEAFLGLTIGCARCHDHKFDPITQRDYYAMQAIFAGLLYGDRRLRGPQNDAWSARVPEVRRRLDGLRDELESLRQQLGLRPPLAEVQVDEFAPVHARAVRMRIAATGAGDAASLYEFEAWSTTATGGAQNVALASQGAKPSASSFALANQTRHFDNLVDGSVDQRQAFPWNAAQPGPAWIQVDFAQPATINRTVWHRGESMPADYVIELLPADSDVWQTVAQTDDRLPRISDSRGAEQVRLAGVSGERTRQLLAKLAEIRAAEDELLRLENGPQVYAASFSPEPEETWLLLRGDPMRRGPQLAPAIPAALGDLKLAIDEAEPNRRLALARHLTRADHPLTARVVVNRIWQHHFGTGLVDTPSDFGRKGAAPSHPELLDWLARDFVAHGWKLKRLHRMIVTSRTYRQSSRPRDEALAVDAETRLLWRFPPRRLEAEAIRDTILSVSGKLNLKMGGPGFDFFQQRGGLSDYIPKETFDEDGWRRMVYAHKIRMQAVDIFGDFDCPDAGQMRPRRTRSITPIQSLGLFNSPFVNQQAAFFAQRLREETGPDTGKQIDRAFWIALSRLPNQAERERLIELADKHGLEQVCRVMLNTSEFVYIQ